MLRICICIILLAINGFSSAHINKSAFDTCDAENFTDKSLYKLNFSNSTHNITYINLPNNLSKLDFNNTLYCGSNIIPIWSMENSEELIMKFKKEDVNWILTESGILETKKGKKNYGVGKSTTEIPTKKNTSKGEFIAYSTHQTMPKINTIYVNTESTESEIIPTTPNQTKETRPTINPTTYQVQVLESTKIPDWTPQKDIVQINVVTFTLIIILALCTGVAIGFAGCQCYQIKCKNKVKLMTNISKLTHEEPRMIICMDKYQAKTNDNYSNKNDQTASRESVTNVQLFENLTIGSHLSTASDGPIYSEPCDITIITKQNNEDEMHNRVKLQQEKSNFTFSTENPEINQQTDTMTDNIVYETPSEIGL